MKRIMIFIGLKVAEISAIIFIPYYLGYLLSKWEWFYEFFEINRMPYWIIGLLFPLLGSLIIACIAMLCYQIIMGNWEWAKKIAGKEVHNEPDV